MWVILYNNEHHLPDRLLRIIDILKRKTKIPKGDLWFLIIFQKRNFIGESVWKIHEFLKGRHQKVHRGLCKLMTTTFNCGVFTQLKQRLRLFRKGKKELN